MYVLYDEDQVHFVQLFKIFQDLALESRKDSLIVVRAQLKASTGVVKEASEQADALGEASCLIAFLFFKPLECIISN